MRRPLGSGEDVSSSLESLSCFLIVISGCSPSLSSSDEYVLGEPSALERGRADVPGVALLETGLGTWDFVTSF